MSRVRGEDQRVEDPKGIQRLLAVSLATFARNHGTSRKNCMKYKEILKRKGGKDSEASTRKKSDQAGVVEEVDDDACNVLMVKSGKGNT